jgi:hypothetical protein
MGRPKKGEEKVAQPPKEKKQGAVVDSAPSVPNAGPTLLEQFKEAAAEAGTQGEMEEKEKKGRRSKAQIEADRQAEIKQQMQSLKGGMEMLTKVGLLILNKVLPGTPAEPNAAEIEMVAEPLGPMLLKYWPDVTAYQNEFALALALTLYISSRITMQVPKSEAEKKAVEEQKADDAEYLSQHNSIL